MNKNTEGPFAYQCPICHGKTEAVKVVTTLPDEILRAEIARRSGRRQTPHRGPGRPMRSRCPGCDQAMPRVELREHRGGCVRDRLRSLDSFKVHLAPKDPDPNPDFNIREVTDSKVVFQKLSSHKRLEVELQKVAEITPSVQERLARVRLHGYVRWDQSSQAWRFVPSVLGRPVFLSST